MTRVVALLAVMAIALAGCGDGAEDTPASDAKELPVTLTAADGDRFRTAIDDGLGAVSNFLSDLQGCLDSTQGPSCVRESVAVADRDLKRAATTAKAVASKVQPKCSSMITKAAEVLAALPADLEPVAQAGRAGDQEAVSAAIDEFSAGVDANQSLLLDAVERCA